MGKFVDVKGREQCTIGPHRLEIRHRFLRPSKACGSTFWFISVALLHSPSLAIVHLALLGHLLQVGTQHDVYRNVGFTALPSNLQTPPCCSTSPGARSLICTVKTIPMKSVIKKSNTMSSTFSLWLDAGFLTMRVSIVGECTERAGGRESRTWAQELPGTVERHSDDFKIEENLEVTLHSFLPLHESFSLCHIKENGIAPVPQENRGVLLLNTPCCRCESQSLFHYCWSRLSHWCYT